MRLMIRFVYPFHRVEFDSANWGHLEYSALPTRAEVDRSLLAILWFSCRVASEQKESNVAKRLEIIEELSLVWPG